MSRYFDITLKYDGTIPETAPPVGFSYDEGNELGKIERTPTGFDVRMGDNRYLDHGLRRPLKKVAESYGAGFLDNLTLSSFKSDFLGESVPPTGKDLAVFEETVREIRDALGETS